MNAMSSPFFCASLGALDPDTIQRLEHWAKSQPGAHVVTQVQGDTVLHAERENKPRKSHMVALRTIFKNWGESVKLEPGFLELMSRADFEAATATGTPLETCVPSAQIKLSLNPGFDERSRQMLAALEIQVK